MISIRLLVQFIAVAEELHFGKAALRLHMAQPPLSQAIKNLEELVGVPLLARNKHFVALTPAGAAFLEEARELLSRNERAIDVARRASQGLTGTITVGFVGSVCYELLPRILVDFQARFPLIRVDLRELTSTEQLDNLRAHRIDLGIVRLPLNNAADMEVRVIANERLIAVLPRDHRLGHLDALRLKDLADEAFMVFPADKIPSLHAKFLLACEKAGFSPRIVLEAWQMASMVSLVAAKLGIVLLPAQVRSIPHPGVVYKEIADQSEHLELKLAAAWNAENVSGAVRSMLSVLP